MVWIFKWNDSTIHSILLVTVVTFIIVHGHSDMKFAHFCLDLYFGDANHSVESIAKFLCDLENPLTSLLGVLFEYYVVLIGKEHYKVWTPRIPTNYCINSIFSWIRTLIYKFSHHYNLHDFCMECILLYNDY
jgi:hypothetical protein